jgi:hypothetical protein
VCVRETEACPPVFPLQARQNLDRRGSDWPALLLAPPPPAHLGGRGGHAGRVCVRAWRGAVGVCACPPRARTWRKTQVWSGPPPPLSARTHGRLLRTLFLSLSPSPPLPPAPAPRCAPPCCAPPLRGQAWCPAGRPRPAGRPGGGAWRFSVRTFFGKLGERKKEKGGAARREGRPGSQADEFFFAQGWGSPERPRRTSLRWLAAPDCPTPARRTTLPARRGGWGEGLATGRVRARTRRGVAPAAPAAPASSPSHPLSAEAEAGGAHCPWPAHAGPTAHPPPRGVRGMPSRSWPGPA